MDYLTIKDNLILKYGSFDQEQQEQLLSCKYIKSSDKVLEIGGNLGRNALIISQIIDNNNFVTMEPNIDFYNKLKENRDINNKSFYIENSALSLNSIYYFESLTYYKSDINVAFPLSYSHLNNNINNIKESNIIDFNQLKLKYNINFNVLCIDCEGAFYYILRDMPYILDNITLIIMENDYENIEHYNYIKTKLEESSFKIIESISYPDIPWEAPCKNNFYEVWAL